MIDHATIATSSNRLPRDWLRAVEKGRFNNSDNDLWVGYSTSRRAVEDAAARAFLALPDERRAALLAAPEPLGTRETTTQKRKRKKQ